MIVEPHATAEDSARQKEKPGDSQSQQIRQVCHHQLRQGQRSPLLSTLTSLPHAKLSRHSVSFPDELPPRGQESHAESDTLHWRLVIDATLFQTRHGLGFNATTTSVMVSSHAHEVLAVYDKSDLFIGHMFFVPQGQLHPKTLEP